MESQIEYDAYDKKTKQHVCNIKGIIINGTMIFYDMKKKQKCENQNLYFTFKDKYHRMLIYK